ncbi:MAG: putative S-layer protein [Candidatus Pacearchaeota archaeon]
MKTKIFALILFTAIFSIALVSATVTFSLTPSDITFSDTQLTQTFVINNTGDEAATFTIPTIKVNGVSVSLTESTFTLNSGATKTVIGTVTASSLDKIIGSEQSSITITARNADLTNTSTETLEVTVDGGSYCKLGEIGDLEIDRVRFDNKGIGKDDEWYLTDEVEVTVRVENTNNDDDIDDVVVSWALYDKKTGKFIMDDEEDSVDIDNGEKEDITFTITLDPDDFDSDFNENDFVFIVKAYSDDLGEDQACTEDQESITIKRDKHYVILDNLELNSETVPCNSIVDITADIVNIGENDEEDVYIIAYNKELGLNEEIKVGDIDALDSKRLSFDFKVPEDADEKSYIIEFRIYDEDEDIFQNDDDDEAIFQTQLNVQGSCGVTNNEASTVTITAELDPETPKAIAGKQVIIRATITNTGDNPVTSVISVFGNSAWSTVSAIDPLAIPLNAGESREVSVYLNIDATASGSQEFTIKATQGTQSTEQRVGLVIESGASQSAIVDHLKQNWFIYAIVIVNIILIIAIISVIRRISARPAAM